ncbi:hypothetical protein [Dactylosporangium sp. CA-139066]|uniref:hypothetical protein n=1 Tax=Dactylosporangium sp. CA-139066 TaxID=3239930 RepID=UPI003D93E8FE
MHELVGRLSDRIRAFERGDAAAVLDDEALREVEQLIGSPTGRRTLSVPTVHAVAWLHWCRYRASSGGDAWSWKAAVGWFRIVLEIDPEQVPAPIRAYLAGDLGVEALLRAEYALELTQTAMLGTDEAALARATGLLERAAEGDANAGVNRPVILWVLGQADRARFALTDDRRYLDQAVARLRAAVAAAGPDEPDLGQMHADLAGALQRRYEAGAEAADLDEAVAGWREGLRLHSADAPDRVGPQSNLALALRMRFEQLGVRDDIDQAVTLGREALRTATPALRAVVQSNLAGALLLRFRHTGATADLDEAVALGREAAEAADEERQLGCRSNLCLALMIRHMASGAAADLDDAIRWGRTAAEAAPRDAPERPAVLTNLAGALHVRFHRTRNLRDLDAAIDYARQAVAATASDRGAPDRGALSDLSMLLLSYFDIDRSRDTLEEAIAAARQGVGGSANATHPSYSSHLANLAEGLLERYRHDAAEADLTEALALLHRAAHHPSAPVARRLDAARSHAEAAARWRGLEAALPMYRVAVGLVPLMAWRGITREDRQRLLHVSGSGLACDAAAGAIGTAAPDLAVALLEQGRGVLWSQLLESRTDLSALRTADQRLADRLAHVRRQLDAPVSAAAERPRMRASDFDRPAARSRLALRGPDAGNAW